MGDMNQTSDPKDYFQQARQIFEEREQEFQMREKTFKEKNASLQNLLEEIANNRKFIEKQKEELETQQMFLDKEKEKVQEQQQQAAALESKAQQLEMQYNLELEKVRNEKMKLERLTSDYEYKMLSLGNGIHQEEVAKGKMVDLTDYIHLSEHTQIVAALTEQKEQLRSEKTNFMRRFLEVDAQLKKLKGTAIHEPVRTSEDVEVEPREEIEKEPEEQIAEVSELQIAETYNQADAVQEELTAEVLSKYLKKNETRMENISIQHSAVGDQLYAEQGGLQYQILFSKPAYFDITAIRKNTSRLRKLLADLNGQYPGIQFRFEEDEGKVYATGYFTNDMKPYELMHQMKEISNCFSQE